LEYFAGNLPQPPWRSAEGPPHVKEDWGWCAGGVSGNTLGQPPPGCASPQPPSSGRLVAGLGPCPRALEAKIHHVGGPFPLVLARIALHFTSLRSWSHFPCFSVMCPTKHLFSNIWKCVNIFTPKKL
jgi:hypothetical protein